MVGVVGVGECRNENREDEDDLGAELEKLCVAADARCSLRR